MLKDKAEVKMGNFSGVDTTFVFLGVLQIEKYGYVISFLALSLYMISMLLCCLMVYVICVEESLHEPMYIFICNLLLNGVFGNTTILPQFIMKLLLGSSTVSFPECLTQAFCVQSFITVEVFTFTTMAYDRYLAMSNPLRYSTLMANIKAMKYIFCIWMASFIFVFIPVMLTSRLQFCGTNINNIFCDNMSLVRLACGNSSVNIIFGLVETLIIAVFIVITVAYCYVRTLWICLKFSKSVSGKAIHTLVSHIITFFVFSTATLFIYLRYRMNGGDLPVTVHVILSMSGLLSSIIVNPVVYGIRTEGLRIKITHHLQDTLRRFFILK